MHISTINERLHQHRQTTLAVNVVHHILTKGLQITEVRDLRADPVEIIEGELDLGLIGNGQEVQDGVGGTAESHQNGNGVFERLPRQQLSNGQTLVQHADDRFTGSVGIGVSPAVIGCRRRGTGKAETQGFRNAGHRVGGIHSATRTLTGCEGTFDAVQVFFGHLAGLDGTDRFEGVDDGDVFFRSIRKLHPAGSNRTGIEENGGKVEARCSHQHSRDRLVTACEQHGAIEALCLHNDFH